MAKALPAYPRGLDFEQVWASIQAIGEKIDRFAEESRERIRETDRQLKENDEQFRKRMAETDRKLQENDERFRKQMKETDEQLRKQMKETDKRISELGSRFGEAIEYMIKPNLVAKFNELGFDFTKIYPETEIKDKANNIFAEVDLTLEDGDKVMFVEVKSKPSIKDVKDHIDRMQKLRLHADLHGSKRKHLGAVAGMVVKDNVRDFALKNGFYVIEPAGDTFNIIKPEGKYKSREW
ncbi:MAG: hypothetical protein LBG72_05480 [Spirochaetaceae bacterium]|nr:hypothetical protein [Spirochaetaceae bacterium]